MSTLIEEQGGGPINPPSAMIERGYLGHQLAQYPDLTPVNQALQELKPARYDLVAHIDRSPLPTPNPNMRDLHFSGELVYRRLVSDGLLRNCFGLEDLSGLIALGKNALLGCLGSLRRIYMWRSVAMLKTDHTLWVPVLRLDNVSGPVDSDCLRWQALTRTVSLTVACARLRFEDMGHDSGEHE